MLKRMVNRYTQAADGAAWYLPKDADEFAAFAMMAFCVERLIRVMFGLF